MLMLVSVLRLRGRLRDDLFLIPYMSWWLETKLEFLFAFITVFTFITVTI